MYTKTSKDNASNSVFNTKLMKTALTELRKHLKAKHMSLRTGLYFDDTKYTFLNKELQEFIIKSTDKDVSYQAYHVTIDFLSNHLIQIITSEIPFLDDFIQYAKQLAMELGYQAIVIRNQIPVPLDCAAELNVPLFPTNSLNRYKINDLFGYLEENHPYYVLELEKGCVHQKIETYRTVLDILEKKQSEIKRFSFIEGYSTYNQLGFNFHHAGYEGKLSVLYEPNGIFVQEKELGFKQQLYSNDQLLQVIDELLELCETTMRLKVLVKPSRKYFDKIFFKISDFPHPLIGNMFTLLEEEFEFEKIEEMSVDVKNCPPITRYQEHVLFFELFGFYFVIHIDTSDVKMYKTKKEAIFEFTSICNQIEEERHQAELKEIQEIANLIDTL
ncbi:hypothetical protein [Bacillus cereus group sp. TH152-1LC]|uniref:hypothetical protein n=1 Tax=Bacillus cereus group sp. TH152-1LC TaxID=3018060 RepID=UPI0022E04C0E|nr:hypothetical protein [Bacillus cereus group sp. TH152-1LC]MDA1675378.1 hypothetical protein [Bacillus cereus group sp. TH152-1LC]